MIRREYARKVCVFSVAALMLFTCATQAAQFRTAYSHWGQCGTGDPTNQSATGDTGLVSIPLLAANSHTFTHNNWAGSYVSTSETSSSATAQPGQLSVQGWAKTTISSTTSYTSVPTTSGSQGISSQFLLDDFIISNESDPQDTTTWLDDVILNVRVRGTFASPLSNDGDSFTLSYYRGYWMQAGQFTSKTPPGSSSLSRGVFKGLSSYQDIDGVFPINIGSIQVGVPFTLGLGVGLDVSASSSARGSSNEHQGYFETVGFVSGGQVLGVPNGFATNSVSGNVFNNIYVPEPTVLGLFCLGIPLILVAQSCRRRVSR